MKKILFALLTITTLSSNAQDISNEVLSSAGSSDASSSHTVDWTIGEPVSETISNADNSVTQGFHQLNFYFYAIEQLGTEAIKISLYPNLLLESAILDLTATDNEKHDVQITDMQGKVLFSGDYPGMEKSILNFNGFIPGTYLVVVSTAKTSQTFKVIKAN